MVKPATIITTCAALLVAICILAVTVKDHFKPDVNFDVSLAQKPVNGSLFADAGLTHNPPHGKRGHRHDLADGAPLPKAAAIAPPATKIGGLLNNDKAAARAAETIETASGVAINPAHGKPGHRCEIAVGTPLNSNPTNNAAPQTANNLSAPPTLNPAHGKPGHKCEIAVGAPLNGNSAKAKQNETVSPTIAAVKPASASSPVPKLNPAHGLSHHRCDIAVGAPLNPAPSVIAPSSPLLKTKTDSVQAVQKLQYTIDKP